MLVTARPSLANGLLLGLSWVATIVGEGDSGPRYLVEDLMVRDTRTLGLQDFKYVLRKLVGLHLCTGDAPKFLHLPDSSFRCMMFTCLTPRHIMEMANVKQTLTAGKVILAAGAWLGAAYIE